MARAHLFRPVTDESGVLLYGAIVTLRNTDATRVISQPIFAGPDADAVAITNPFEATNGYIDVWLNTPERVNVLVQGPGRSDIAVSLDVQPPAPQIVRSSTPLTITNTPSAGTVLTGVDDKSASWQPIPVPPVGTVPVHYHPGDGANSVALGTAAEASATDTTAVGDHAVASAAQGTAFGHAATAAGPGTTAVGDSATATGDGDTAVGSQSDATGGGATALGSGAQATGAHATSVGSGALALNDDATALGRSASANGLAATAIGSSAQASGESAVALGTGAAARHVRSVAIGDGSVTSADDQVVLGSDSHTVQALGSLQVFGDAVLGSDTGLVGFFGAGGATRQAVTGSDGGDLALRALLGLLDDLGLILNQTTQD